MKWLVGSFFLLVLLGLILMIISRTNLRKIIKDNWKKILIFIIINIVVINVIAYLHLRQEDFIAYWDFGGFWSRTIEFEQMMDRSIPEAMTNVVNSIMNDEYNLVAEWFLYPFVKIIGNSYPRFVLSMINVFLIPTNTMMFITGLYLQDTRNKKSIWLTVVIGLLIIGLGSNIRPLVEGYIGSAGLIIISTIMLLTISGAYEEKNIPLSLCTGIYLLLLLLIRRWYAYFIVTYFVFMVIHFVIKNLHEMNKDKIVTFLFNVVTCGLTALIILVVGFNKLFMTITTYDYASAYSVMKIGGFDFFVSEFTKTYGLIFIIIAIVGIFYHIKDRDESSISISLFIQIVLVLILFNRVQVLGSHHYYIISIMMMLLMFNGLFLLDEILDKRLAILTCVVAVLVSFNVTRTIISKDLEYAPAYTYSNMLVSKYMPDLRIDTNKPKVEQLVSYLNSVAQEYQYVYVLSSSGSFNEDMLKNALLPQEIEGVKNLIPSSSYDARDGVPYSFFQYYYIVVADPIQLQFGEEGQRCVQVLADFMLNDPRVKQYYQTVQEIPFDNGITIKVYMRIEQVPNSIRQEISDIYKGYYPDNPNMYTFEMLNE